ncbi:hypothetical protein B0H13DRAFT_2381968 [Mycena leptocephala]|nr:hypothetical protein B0H13DRAFT_2381968 [Mycena leptocephala]
MPSNNTNLDDPLVASSYFNPGGGEAYGPMRRAMVAQATAMGYEAPTMTEHGVMWADDQDPLPCQWFESFGKTLGDRYDDLQRAEGVGVILKSQTIDLKHQVKYPDSVRITEVKPDRYFRVATLWSYQQQAIVAESSGYAVFFDYRKSRVANLLEYGGVYADLHRDLSERSKRSNELYAQWVSDHPKSTNKAKL